MSLHPTVVNSRAELVEYFTANPRRLVAVRKSAPPKVGHPDFIGPIQLAVMRRPGVIQFEADGSAFIELRPSGRASCRGV